MDCSNLLLGDIVFFMNHYKKPGSDEEEYTYIDHVALYAGINEKGQHMLIHSISGNMNYYDRTARTGLCKTTLRALKNQIDTDAKPNRYYDVSFHVFRYQKDSLYAKRALDILNQQAAYYIPYDEKRLNAKLEKEDNEEFDEVAFKNLGETSYRTSGIYRSIKYAARHPSPLNRTRENGIGRGLTCSMAVILAYQIAELKIKNLVESIPQDAQYWVSDKYAQPNDTTGKFPKAFEDYLKSIRSDSYAETSINPAARLSYSCWKSDEVSPENFTHETLPVDAKSIGAAGLRAHLESRGADWVYLGVLNAPEIKFTTEEKLAERAKRELAYNSALQTWTEACASRPSLISPAFSISPAPSRTPPTDHSSLGDSSDDFRTIPPWFNAVSLPIQPRFHSADEGARQGDTPGLFFNKPNKKVERKTQSSDATMEDLRGGGGRQPIRGQFFMPAVLPQATISTHPRSQSETIMTEINPDRAASQPNFSPLLDF